MPIAFILSSQDEEEKFKEIIEPYNGILTISCHSFDDIARYYGLEIDSEGILKKYGHTSYQMLKKIYSMLYIDAERYFVLDSEAVWIDKINMSELFDEFYRKPFVVVSNFTSRIKCDNFLKDHFDATNYIIGKKMDKMLFEHFVWFYEKKIIKAVCERYGTPYSMMLKVYNWEMDTKGHSVGLMETMLLLNYLYENSQKLGYQIITVEEELEKQLGSKGKEKFIQRFFQLSNGGNLGILEFPCMMLTIKNYRQLAQIYSNNKIFVTRCDDTSIFNYWLEKQFFKLAHIKILAVSQSHGFLPEITKGQLLYILIRDTYHSIKKILSKG